MKFLPLVALFVASALLAACNSLDNPLAGMNLLRTGNDGRVYNPQTGEFEWPKDTTPRPRSHKTADISAALKTTPTPPPGDGRYYDAQKSQWVDPSPQSSAGQSPSSKPKPKPKPTAAAGAPAPSLLPPTPPPATPAPAHARGVYDPSTGKIEWQSYEGPPMATPAPKKRWWPF